MIANTSCRIIQDWVINLNDDMEHLAFHIIGQSHMIHYVNYVIDMHFGVTWEVFNWAIIVVKAQCIVAHDVLDFKWKQRFPNHELTNLFGINSPQYWLQLDWEFFFINHLALIKRHYHTSKQVGTNGKWVFGPFWIYKVFFSSWPWRIKPLRPW